jgi:hypothetical protein
VSGIDRSGKEVNVLDPTGQFLPRERDSLLALTSLNAVRVVLQGGLIGTLLRRSQYSEQRQRIAP